MEACNRRSYLTGGRTTGNDGDAFLRCAITDEPLASSAGEDFKCTLERHLSIGRKIIELLRNSDIKGFIETS